MTRQERVQASLACFDWRDGQPCVGCPCSAACADLELACASFRAWVQGNRPKSRAASREPSRRLFLLTMQADPEEV